MSDHWVLVFHMHQVAEPLNPMLMNKTRQSKQLRPCIEGERKKTPAQKVKRWSLLSLKICHGKRLTITREFFFQMGKEREQHLRSHLGRCLKMLQHVFIKVYTFNCIAMWPKF